MRWKSLAGQVAQPLKKVRPIGRKPRVGMDPPAHLGGERLIPGVRPLTSAAKPPASRNSPVIGSSGLTEVLVVRG
jgi:hypothetical protein